MTAFLAEAPDLKVEGRKLVDPKSFFDGIRPVLFPKGLTVSQVAGIETKLAAIGLAMWPVAWTAYGLATSWWETGRKMQPVEEGARGRNRPYGVADETGQVPYGRGDVQLTWRRNYVTMDDKLGLAGTLAADYSLALDPAISARILVVGMEHGLFTGKRLSDYLPMRAPASQAEFERARRIINGTDKAREIAVAALAFQDGLVAGAWA